MFSYDVIVNKSHPFTRHMRPHDLREPDICWSKDAVGEKRLMRKEAALQIEHMFYNAEQQGIHLLGVSGFRSYERQETIYLESMKKRGAEHTEKYIAFPGTSEHQTGLAMDVSCGELKGELEETFAQTREGIWLEKNASLYGFIIRYPKGKEELTGYAYEPWHIRYVTKPLAFYLTKMRMVLEEYHSLSSTVPSADDDAMMPRML